MSSKILNLIRIFLVNEVYGSLLACGDSDDKEELTTYLEKVKKFKMNISLC